MPYAGKTLMQRQVTDLAVHAHDESGVAPFKELKVEVTAVIGAESHYSVGAYHDNAAANNLRAELLDRPEWLESRTVVEALDARRKLSGAEDFASRDCGLGQVNIPWREVGTPAEDALRTASLDPAVYRPIAQQNLNAVASLFTEPWTFGDGKHERRQWQAWVAYRTGWALEPEAWVWHRDPVTGDAIGPWVQTGRYLHQAIRAVPNWHLYTNLTYGPPEKASAQEHALGEAVRLATIYEVPLSDHFRLDFDLRHGVYWHFPLAPTHEGTAADYPKPNDGRSFLLSR